MSCHSCLVKFNFFHKEVGCGNCGLSFCSKCLKQKCRVPSKGNIELNVCKNCYSQLAAGTSHTQNTIIPPPDSYLNTDPSNPKSKLFMKYQLRRLENLENPSAPPITIYQKSNQLQKLRSGLAPVDVQILERLERLREDRNKIIPSENEIRNRLANLRGENPYVDEPKKMQFLPDTRTDQQKADDLLEQFGSEREIELSYNPQEGIEARIASLREQGVRPNENSYMSNLHDSSSSEDEVDKITRKIMDEVALDERCPAPSKASEETSDTEMKMDSPELPWCILCNKDAAVKCIDCSGDLYCVSCCKEVHNRFDTDHKIIPYKKASLT